MITKLIGETQNYNWGGTQYLPRLLNLPNNDLQPFAEYWLGAHPKAPSSIINNEEGLSPLNAEITASPVTFLGKETLNKFGRLPYLFKILDVSKMLSIQVHPSKEEAEKGFKRENKAGIPLHATNRNYKDDNHKPEMMVALSDFYLLHGFMEQPALSERLETIPEFKALSPVFENEGYQKLYETVMTMPQEEVTAILTPLVKRSLSRYQSQQLKKTDPSFWAARAVDSGMTTMDHIDRGIFSIYFFNLLHLQPGEGIFQAAGIPHAYLEGQNIELMANSDNVLRAGLTQKHVDVDELLQHTLFQGVCPNILRPHTDTTVVNYPCPIADFYLQQIRITKGETYSFSPYSLEIILLLSGSIAFPGSNQPKIHTGEAIIATAEEQVSFIAEEDTVIFKAGVPKE